MPTAVDLDKLDLAALLCSRVCHDVIGPVGAIVNGLEMLEDDDDPGSRAETLKLIVSSSQQAAARLKFVRIAFGAAGSAGAQIDLGDAEQVARGFIEDEVTKLDWQLPRLLLPKNRVKLLLNLLLVAIATLPKGGTISVAAEGDAETGGFIIHTAGEKALVPAHVSTLLSGAVPEDRVMDAHMIQPHYTGLLARTVGLTVAVTPEPGGVRIEAITA